METEIEVRLRIEVNGIVQGVGFRPFIYRIAQNANLCGFVNNNEHGVLIEVQGSKQAVTSFPNKIKEQAPPLSHIVDITTTHLPTLQDETTFKIVTTSNSKEAKTYISPDVAICDDCLREMNDPHNHRFRYPFINCTNCGPRYTIVKQIPYDRPFTSMSQFPLCPQCKAEYHNPADRRFHAQPNACPKCGPHIELWDAHKRMCSKEEALQQAVDYLKKGHILAIRGLGGFHLVANAFNSESLQQLRKRKLRGSKPFALMAPTLKSIEKHCFVSKEEAQSLAHYTRPIVLLKTNTNSTLPLKHIAPNNQFLGFMLPYTPLHYLLLEHFEALVMTSANFSDEPIAIANNEARERLTTIADYFLLHNREILQRCDDSILRITNQTPRIIRRARGFTPSPFFLQQSNNKNILAVGAELKNSIALSRQNAVFHSQHIGDLDNPQAFNFFENSITHLQEILQLKPDVIVCDKHPEYLSSKWAKKQNLPLLQVQHHHAHLASVMAENSITEPTIGLIMDGTGWGEDETIWGGEVLVGDFNEYKRFAWLKPLPLPGGSAAIKEPWRMALSYLLSAYKDETVLSVLPFLNKISKNEITILKQMIDKGLNSPLSSGCGRLFDAVSALLGLGNRVTFEAEAAIKLEMICSREEVQPYAINFANKGCINLAELIRSIVADIEMKVPKSTISTRFHLTFAHLLKDLAINARTETGIEMVGLSGGVFQNQYLFETVVKLLEKEKFTVLTHAQFPTNDGGIALGQIALAQALLKAN